MQDTRTKTVASSNDPEVQRMIQAYEATMRPWQGTFDAQTVMSDAERLTGLSDWGGSRWNEDSFRHDLALLCASMEATGELDQRGRGRSYARLMTMLISRLRYLDARKNTAGVDAERIVAPLIGTGMPRAGTTFLHGVIAQDPDLRVVKAYEAVIPVSLPGPDGDVRSALYERLLDYQGMTDERLRAMHPFGAELPEECLFMQEGACTAMFGGLWIVPEFLGAMAGKIDVAYEWQIGIMQYLQTISRGERWALKSPAHIHTWDEMRLAFPDALVYVNHRDPGKVIPSMGSLMMALQGLFSGYEHDPVDVGRKQLATSAAAMNNYTEWRKGPGREMNVVDVVFSDLIARPLEVIGELYDTFGLHLTQEAREHMQRHLDRDHHGKGPQRAYTLEEFGLTDADIEETFGEYIDHFGIRRERR